MARRNRTDSKVESSIYHVFNRGLGRQIIFETVSDRQYFKSLLKKFISEYEVSVYAWVLMNNHFHFVLQGDLEEISAFMRHLQSRYAAYFNKKYDREGSLFQSRYRSEGIKNRMQFAATIRYCHLNPVKGGLSKDCDYQWSSFGEYYNDEPEIINAQFVENFFENAQAFKLFHTMKEDNTVNPIDDEEIPTRYGSMSDDNAIRISKKTFGNNWRRKLFSSNQNQRDAVLRKLKALGLRINQIQRLTGLGKSIIRRA